MAAPLLDMAQRACIRHVMDLQDVGELSYKVIRPVLKSVTNPAQLRQIEEASPHIAEDDAELWEAFIRRDISKAESRLKTTRPRNPSSWWKVYRKLKREDETETKAAEEKLKAALNRHKVDKGSKQTNIVRAVIPSGEKRTGWSAGPKEKPFGAQALKNAKTAADTITILKRQTAQRQAGRSVAQSTPMHQLQQMRGKVAQAPAHMIRQYAQKPGPSRPAPIAPQPQAYRPVFASKPQTQADRALVTALNQNKQEQEARERRLLALTSGPSTNKPRPTAAAAPARPPPATLAATAAPRRSSPIPVRKPSPVHHTSGSNLVRKRPAYDPFLPAKKRRP
ncbi:hypothetical protein D6C86_04688 [Aureobasidium pullulans]|uniref:RNA polymerase II transcription factor SIII subunit A n=1 Tax=Aureobasidium pullulans TaxID=5580 RepID=A0A4S9W752_AURPU|nr:hypothetical protein D6C94_07835 [Aureobasidium pullulans]THZ44088.1 hypothetical protein D6C87_03827 [Aureobasidium pullulans]THZ61053.1 hypothetical protein D6C86_04688 [Aureobasidium pullulans]THZ97709.1 hypothetical protein D6C88_01144 [Aureobasidium pullulans]